MMIDDVFVWYCREKSTLFLNYFWHFPTACSTFAKHMKNFTQIDLKLGVLYFGTF